MTASASLRKTHTVTSGDPAGDLAIDTVDSPVDVASREPRWDDASGSWIIKEDEAWVVTVTKMLFNHRVCFSHRIDYPMTWSAGWCYPDRVSAVLAAAAWEPTSEPEPVGYIKRAAHDGSLPLPLGTP